MAIAFERVVARMNEAQEGGQKDQSDLLKNLSPKQRKVLILFEKANIITAKDIASLLGLKPRSTTKLCQEWVTSGFFELADSSRKGRKYRLKARPLT